MHSHLKALRWHVSKIYELPLEQRRESWSSQPDSVISVEESKSHWLCFHYLLNDERLNMIILSHHMSFITYGFRDESYIVHSFPYNHCLQNSFVIFIKPKVHFSLLILLIRGVWKKN